MYSYVHKLNIQPKMLKGKTENDFVLAILYNAKHLGI